MNEYSGIIIINKPVGGSSHKCVSIARRALNMKKIGHTGTLDPEASGVLPLLVGKATRAADFLTAEDKCYRAGILLGTKTDTLDLSGTVLEKNNVDLPEEKVREVVKSFEGDSMQIPPMYSAISVNGQRLYSLARQGIEIERKARPITIYSIDIVSISLPHVVIDVHCSKGTYIRSLAADIGEALGVGGTIESLERTRCGSFSIENSVTPDELISLCEKGEAQSVILPVDSFFSNLREIRLDKKSAERVKNGVPIYYKVETQNELFRIYDEKGEFIALSKSDVEDGKSCLRLIKGFY